jgi:hypothetical protein
MVHTKSGIALPTPPSPQACRQHMRKTGRKHVAMGIGALIEPDGSIAWQDEEWQLNALHDAGEQSMLNVYLKEQANVTKFLALTSTATGSLVETMGTMSAITESKAPGVDGYNRQQILAADWTDDGLQGGDYRFSAAEKTFGPITGTSASATAAALCTTSTGAGLLLLTLALSATTTIAVNQSFKYILRWTQQ